jgi:starch phosphorylase
MKLALNGALTIGTLDGATIEMRSAIGDDLVFIFGLTADEVAERRRGGHDPRAISAADPELRQSLDMIAGGYFSADAADRFWPLVNDLIAGGDHIAAGRLRGLRRCQERVDALYATRTRARRAILNTAACRSRAIGRARAAERVWGVLPHAYEARAAPAISSTSRRSPHQEINASQ